MIMAASANTQEGMSNVSGASDQNPFRLNSTKPLAEWTPEEQALLEECFTKYASDTVIVRCSKIAVQLNDKTVRDVAVRCKSFNEWFLNNQKKEKGKQRKEEDNSARKNKDKKSQEKVKSTLLKSSHAAKGSAGPSLAPPVMSKDSDDDICYKAIGDATDQLLEKNAQTLDQISANLSSLKLNENINLLSQARDNLLTLLNEMNDMPSDIMKQMPPLPVKLNEKLANSILHPPTVQKKKK